MQTLELNEIDQVNGAGVMGQIGAAMGGFAAIAGGLAMVPSPATPALGAFAVVTGVLGGVFSYLDSRMEN
jgi:hypothetical protein